MPSSLDVIAQYLSDSISAERSIETQLRNSSKDGDDSDVQAYFQISANRAGVHIQLLEKRLAALNGPERQSNQLLGEILSIGPKAAQIGHIAEERIVQNLIRAFSITRSACAMYLALEAAARACRDEQTAELATQLATDEGETAEQFWRFLPSRSKIAYNVLTAGEVDPAVETRAPDDRLSETRS